MFSLSSSKCVTYSYKLYQLFICLSLGLPYCELEVNISVTVSLLVTSICIYLSYIPEYSQSVEGIKKWENTPYMSLG